jgi:phosphatidylinositol glycan class W
MFAKKLAKEAFVMGLEGTTPLELLLVLSCIPIGFWSFQFLPSANPWQSSVSEAITFWIPMILCQSKLLYPYGVLYLASELTFAIINESVRPNREVLKRTDDMRRVTLTVYRSSLLYLTFVAILSVDFHFFPRRFAKTEERGYSLMDMGAASFVIAAGLVSTRARGKTANTRRDFARTLPLLTLGVLRLIAHKELEYQEHVSEYGVHWNFSFTLAILSPVGALLPGPTWTLPVALLSFYQFALSSFGLQTWIEDSPRQCLEFDHNICHFFAANREGLLGCVGYSAIYLLSEWFGSQYLWRAPDDNYRLKFGLFKFTGGLTLFWLILEASGLTASRRSTNLVFAVWVLLVNILILTTVRYVCAGHDKVPFVLNTVNKHGLPCFVGANLMTGIVNLSFDTMQQNDTTAFVILLVYISGVGTLAVSLNILIPKLKGFFSRLPPGKEKIM